MVTMDIIEDPVKFAYFVMDMAILNPNFDEIMVVLQRHIPELSPEALRSLAEPFHKLAVYLMYNFMKTNNYRGSYKKYVSGIHPNSIEGVHIRLIPEYVASRILVLLRYDHFIKNNENDQQVITRFLKKVIDPIIKHTHGMKLNIDICDQCGKIYVQKRSSQLYCSESCNGVAKQRRFRDRLKEKSSEKRSRKKSQ